MITSEPRSAGLSAIFTRPFFRLVLVMAVLAILPPLVVSVGVRPPDRIMENIALLSSQQTWLQLHQAETATEPEARAASWLIPTIHGHERIRKPPMLVWLHLLAWTDLSPGEVSPQELLARSRLVAVGMTVVTLLAVCWLGLTVGGPRVALGALLAAGTMWFFQRQGRTPTYDIYMVTFATASVAFGIWAMAQHATTGGRRHLTRGAWGVCGVLLACAILTKGPLALLLVCVPLLVGVWCVREGARSEAWMGMASAMALGVGLAGVWYLLVYLRIDDAWSVWFDEFQAERPEDQPVYYYLAIVGLVFPWSIWLVGGLAHPFLSATGAERRRRTFALAWFVVLLIAFSVPGAKQQRYILPIIPVSAILIAQVFADHARAAMSGAPDLTAWRLVVPHWIMLIVVSSGALLASLAPETVNVPTWMIAFLDERGLRVGFVAMGVVLVAIAAVGWIAHRRRGPMAGLAFTACWMIILTTGLWWVYDHQPSPMHVDQDRASRLAPIIGEHPVYGFRSGDSSLDVIFRHEAFLFYLSRIVAPVNERGLESIRSKSAFVIASTQPEVDEAMLAHDFVRVMEFESNADARWTLWRSPIDETDAPVVSFSHGIREGQTRLLASSRSLPPYRPSRMPRRSGR